MASTATVTMRPWARWTAATPPARSIWDIIQPPKMSPLELASAGMAMVRIAGTRSVGGWSFEVVSVMTHLFSSAAKKSADYSAKDIEVLEGLEPVRRRPGMYIGGTDERAMHHLVAEVIDNSMDEAVAGHATRIEVELGTGNRLTVIDNGRGIPVDPHPKFKDKSALEVIMCTLHSGGKFDSKVYETSGGLHGVGVSV